MIGRGPGGTSPVCKRNCTRVWMLGACVVGLALTLATSARADATQVGVDLTNKKFSSLLPYFKDLDLSFHVDEHSTVTTTFWRIDNGKTCPTKPPPGATKVSSLRSGDPKDGKVDLLAHIGRLSVGFTYCFRFVVETRTPIASTQKAELSRELFRAVAAYARTAADSTPPDQTPKAPRGAAILNELKPEGNPLLLTRVIRNGHRYQSLWEELKDRLPQNQQLLELLHSTFRKQVALDRNAHLSEYTDVIDYVLGQAKPKGPVIFYEPIRNWKHVRNKLATKPNLKKALAKIKTESAFLTWLSKSCTEDTATRHNCLDELIGPLKKGRRGNISLDAEEEDDLERYFTSHPTPFAFSINVKKLEKLEGELHESGPKFKARKDALDAFLKEEGLPSSMTGWPHADAGSPATVLVTKLRDQKLLDDLVEDESVTALSGDAWEAFLADVQADTSRSVSGTGVVMRGPPEDVFPAYIGLDVGVAIAGFPDRTEALGSVEPVQYVGLNFYLGAVDKDDPVTEATPFRQRFGFTAGMHVLAPSVLGDRGVKGILGDRMLLVGAGFRVTTYVRLSAGAILFDYVNPSALVDERHLSARPYASVSLDFDTFGAIAGKYK